MKKCLILITNYYPFFKGEEYLETEIKYLADKFEKIYIISTMVSKDMIQTREVPSNTIIISSKLNHSKFGKLSMVLKRIIELNTNKNRKKIISDDCKDSNIKNKIYCSYFECRALEVYKNIEKYLDENDLNKENDIIIYSYWLYITAKLGIELKYRYFKNKKVKLITRAHRYDLYEEQAPLKYLPQRRFLLSEYDAIYPCSQDGVDFLANKYSEYSNKISVKRLGTISNGVKPKINNKILHIITCSAVRKVKRLDLLIKSLKILENKKIDYRWTHIGDGPEFEQIKLLAKQNLKSKKIDFKGFMENKNVMEWYKNNEVTVFVNISSSEGVPVSIMEAMSMGIPIIATDVGGTREIVINEQNGYLLKSDLTENDLSDVILKIKSLSIEKISLLSNKSLELWKLKSDAAILYNMFATEL